MSTVRQIDWDAARALHPPLHPWLLSGDSLQAARERGLSGEAYACASGEPTDVLFVQRTPFGDGTRADIYLEAETEPAADALMDALEPGQEYWASYATTYRCRQVVERRLVGSRIYGEYHYRLHAAGFRPTPHADARVIRADDEALQGYHDEFDGKTVHAVETSGVEGNPCYGLFAHGRLVAVACTLASNVSWVHTQAESRRAGCASAVVSAATASILSRYEGATYDAATDNEASTRLCRRLGFQVASETVLWVGRAAERA